MLDRHYDFFLNGTRQWRYQPRFVGLAPRGLLPCSTLFGSFASLPTAIGTGETQEKGRPPEEPLVEDWVIEVAVLKQVVIDCRCCCRHYLICFLK